jgi:hypothetical protein
MAMMFVLGWFWPWMALGFGLSSESFLKEGRRALSISKYFKRETLDGRHFGVMY